MNELYLFCDFCRFILASRRQDSTLLQCLENETCKKKLSWRYLTVIKLFCNNVSLQIEVKKNSPLFCYRIASGLSDAIKNLVKSMEKAYTGNVCCPI